MLVAIIGLACRTTVAADATSERSNVLFIISDDLTATARMIRPRGPSGSTVPAPNGKPPAAEELLLSEGQRAKAQELLKRVEELWHDTFRNIGQTPAAERHRHFVERSQLNEADLKAMLSPEQLRRLHQLDLQADVAAALREPEVLAKINLTEEQRDHIKTIEQQEMAHWRGAHQRDALPNIAEKNLGKKSPSSRNEHITRSADDGARDFQSWRRRIRWQTRRRTWRIRPVGSGLLVCDRDRLRGSASVCVAHGFRADWSLRV